MRVVLFLGAGFSVPFGFPVMNTFMAFADSCSRIDDDDRKVLRELRLAARQANAFLESSPTNLEDMLSFAVMGERLGLGDDPKGHADRLRLILQKVFTSIGGDDFWAKYDNFDKFVDFKRNLVHELSVVTTNYDLNVECALHRAGLRAYPGFTPSVEKDGGKLYRADGVPVFKLHGSVNWYEMKENADCFQVDDRFVSAGTGRPGGPSVEEIPAVCATNYRPPRSPFIVPPSFLKPELVGPMRRVWAGAAEVLAHADLIVFVGYSFPSSDTEMKYFLARPLANNATLRRISLIDPSAETIVARLKDERSGFGSHFRGLLCARSADWQRHHLTREISAAMDFRTAE